MSCYANVLKYAFALLILISVPSFAASALPDLPTLTSTAWQQPREALHRLQQAESEIHPESEEQRAELAWVRACAYLALQDADSAERAIEQGLRWAGAHRDLALRLRLLKALIDDMRGLTVDALTQSTALYTEINSFAEGSLLTRQFAAVVYGSLQAAQANFTSGLPALRQANERLDDATPEWLRLQAKLGYIDALNWSGNWQEAWRLSQRLIEHIGENNSGLLFGYVFSQYSWMVVYESGIEVGLQWQQRYRAQAEQHGSDLNRLMAAIAVASMLTDANRHSEARKLLQEFEVVAREARIPYPMIRWLQLAALIASNERREQDAMAAINEAIARNEQLQPNFLRLLLRDIRAQILANFGHLEQALQEQSEVMESRLAALQKENQARQEHVEQLSTKLAEREAELLRRDNALQALQIEASDRRNRALLVWITLAIAMISALFVLLWRNHRISRKLRELADTDSLTGLPNRRALMHAAESEFARAKRYAEPFSVAVIDLDFFKQINDRFGHEVGDQVLRQFAKLCTDNLRETDVIGRTGGEEFVLLMPHTDSEAALLLAERLRVQVEQIAETLAIDGLRTQASFGVATFAPIDDNFKQLLIRADHALYRAKSEGRNQVRQAEETTLEKLS